MSILNLTRKFLPKLSAIKAENISYINAIPESRLANAIRNGDKSIVRVGMNSCGAARITPKGINTIYTDGFWGCNSVGIVCKGLDGNPISILSHYTPLQTSRSLQASAINKQLQVYDYYIDKNFKPKVFYNIAGIEKNSKLEAAPNPITKELKNVFDKWFKKGYEEKIIPYENGKRPDFFSAAHIFQFDPQNVNKLKMTTVGEKEHFIDLSI